MEKNENKVISKKQKNGIFLIQKLLEAMHKDIKELMNYENLGVSAQKIKTKSVRISKIAIALQKSLDIDGGGEVANNLDHLYKHIRFAVARVIDENDFSYLTSAEKVTAEINEGWSKISFAAA